MSKIEKDILKSSKIKKSYNVEKEVRTVILKYGNRKKLGIDVNLQNNIFEESFSAKLFV